MPLILASASRSRAALLTAAGLAFAVEPAHVDEDEVKASLKAEGAKAEDVAAALAAIKAAKIGGKHPNDHVIGCDQVLDCEGRLFDKPPSLDAARAQLLALRGKTHRLVSAAVLVSGGAEIWRHVAVARLTVRAFSDGFLDGYLARAGEGALSSVGAYQLEGLGVQLFSRIEGDYFTILGLPLLPLLDALRNHGYVTP